MGEIVWLINCTLDGRCGHQAVIADDDLHRHATETLQGIDAVLFGRKTFELLEPYWSEVARERSGNDVENAFADAMTAVPKLVFSRTVESVGWNGRVLAGSPVDEVRGLRQGDGRYLVQASPNLASQLVAAGLVDRCRLVLQPMASATGPVLFAEPVQLTLQSAVAFDSGAIALDYAFN